MNNKHTGSSFDSWLEEEGIYDEVTSVAIKRVLARQISDAMREQSLSKSAMALRMATSRSSLDRLLDPQNDAVSLQTLTKAAQAVGRTLRLELV
jgi:antitoxin HicB